jgi:nitroreductase
MRSGVAAREAPALAADARQLLLRIAGRRSTPPRCLIAPGPSESEIEQIVRAACAAPDHKGLQPFRFEWIGIEDRSRLAEAFEVAERELNPEASPEVLARERERAQHAPILLALIVCEQECDVPIIEQRASAGAALGYALLAADCLGYGAMAVSGEKLATAALRGAFGLEANERLLCFIAVGTPEKRRGPRDEPDLAVRLQRWDPLS